MNPEEQLRAEFEDIIRNKLTNDQFNEWLLGWIDIEDKIKIALDWDIETIKEEIKELKKIIN